jgi:hypothetical protein
MYRKKLFLFKTKKKLAVPYYRLVYLNSVQLWQWPIRDRTRKKPERCHRKRLVKNFLENFSKKKEFPWSHVHRIKVERGHLKHCHTELKRWTVVQIIDSDSSCTSTFFMSIEKYSYVRWIVPGPYRRRQLILYHQTEESSDNSFVGWQRGVYWKFRPWAKSSDNEPLTDREPIIGSSVLGMKVLTNLL